MEYLLNIVSFLIFAYSCKSTKYKQSLLVIYSGLWFFVSFMYSFHFYGLYDVKDETLLMYILGIIFYFVGYITYRQHYYVFFTRVDNYRKKMIILKILILISIVVLFKKSLLAIPLWLSGGVDNLKSSIVEQKSLSLGFWGDFFFTFVARPMLMVAVLYSVILLFQNKKEYCLYIFTFVMSFLGYVCTGSKFIIMELVTMVFTYLLIFRGGQIYALFRYNKKIFYSTFLVIVLLLLLLNSKDGELCQSIYIYLCGCIPCSDKALIIIDEHPHFYGTITFNGFFRIFSLPLSFLGNEFKDILDNGFLFMQKFEHTMHISPTISYNAFISLYSYFYADGGLVGVALFSFLFGYFSNKICTQSILNPTYMNVAMLLFTSILISTSMVRANTFMIYYVLPYFYIYFLIPKSSFLLNDDSF